jgi:hypothetical protein
MARVNIVKKIKVDGVWKLLSLPRNQKGNYDWNALPQGCTSSSGTRAASAAANPPVPHRGGCNILSVN